MNVKKSNNAFKLNGPNDEGFLNSISNALIRSKFTKPTGGASTCTTGGASNAKRVVTNRASIA